MYPSSSEYVQCWQLAVAHRVKTHLEPFTIATLALQAPDAKLPVVPITLGNLYRIFLDPSIETSVRHTVHESLEKRWGAGQRQTKMFSLRLYY
jgi:hypothetical protein